MMIKTKGDTMGMPLDTMMRGRRGRGWPIVGAMLIASTLAYGSLIGCVQINAPDRPIEIVLNINIRQEVVFRLDRDAKELIEQNAEIF